jgi:HlyD family secretion protein
MAGRSRILSIGVPLLGGLLGGAAVVQIAATAPDRPITEPPRAPASSPLVPAAADAGRARQIAASGIVEPSSEQVRIGTERSGVVAAVQVQPGDRIAAGQVLFRLDDRQAAADVATRRRQHEAALARLAESEAGIPAARARVDAAAADLADRREQLRLVSGLGDRRAVSAEDVSRRRFAVQAAEARLAEARANLALLDGPRGGATIAAQRASAEEMSAAVAAAEVERERLTVRSPIDGVVLQVNLRVGEFAQAGVLTTPLMIVGALDPLHVRVEIDEVDAVRFDPAGRATASPRGAVERRAAMRFVRVEPLVVPKTSLSGSATERTDTRVLQVVYALDASEMRVFPGQAVDVFIELPAAPQVAGRAR